MDRRSDPPDRAHGAAFHRGPRHLSTASCNTKHCGAKKMAMILTYSYRIKGNAAAKRLSQMAIAANQVWNFCGGIHDDSRRLNRPWPSWYDLVKLTSGSSKEIGLHAATIQGVCKQFVISRNKIKHRPAWRVSFGARRSLGWVPFQCARRIRVQGDTVRFLGHDYRIWLSRPIPPTFKSGGFSQDAAGRWYLNLACEVSADLPAGAGEVGIDLGLTTLATFSTGEKVANPRHLRQSAAKLARAQRAGRKALARKIHRKVAARRRHHLHELSSRIARENSLVVVGDVNSAALARTGMAKSVLDAGWSAFRRMLQYKMAMRPGAWFINVNERMTTQTCSGCQTVGGPKGREGLRVRSWVCEGCGVLHDRDTNAALNILASGRSAALLTEVSVL